MRSRLPRIWTDENCRELFHRAVKLTEKGDMSANRFVSTLGRSMLYGRYDDVRRYIAANREEVHTIWRT